MASLRAVAACSLVLGVGGCSSPATRPGPREPCAAGASEFVRSASGEAVDGQVVRAPAVPRAQRIAILPDRTTGRDWGLPYLDAAVSDLAVVRPDAVFTVGDMVQGYTKDPARWDREVADYQSRIAALPAAFFPTPGNHDVISGARSPADRTFANRYRARFGPLRYSVDLELATAIVIFSDEAMGDGAPVLGDEQLAWLGEALVRARGRGHPIFLLMHRPLWRSPSVGWDSRVQPLLEAAGVDAVIAGHFHALQRDPDRGGVQYHILGTCGGMIDQHPLAGQLQHLTFVDCVADGSLRVWHQPVGLVLPEDFVVREDQDRVWKLRESRTVQTRGTLPDPTSIGTATACSVAVEVRNPLDLPIRLRTAPPGVVQLPGAPAAWWTAGGGGRGQGLPAGGRNGWTSHALADIDNEHTMASGRRTMVAVTGGPIDEEVPAKATRRFMIPLELLPSAAGEVRVPQLDLYATFVDSKGRTVPVWLPTRVPVARTVRPAVRGAAFPLLAWDYSPYDTREANPTARVEDGADGTLLVRIEVPDDVRSAPPEWTEADSVRRSNPHGDAVRVLLAGDGRMAVDVLIEPFAPGAPTRQGPASWSPSIGPEGTWAIEVRIGGDAAAGARRLQVGVADNDDTYHTQWRWLAPGGSDGGWEISRERPGADFR